VLYLGGFADDDRVKLIQKRLKFFFDVHVSTLPQIPAMNATGFFTHKDCRKHEMGAGHPECPERLDAIEDWLLATGVADALDKREAPQASIADIELAHDRMMIAALRGLSDGLADDIRAGGPAYAQIDPDTSLNVHTWNAALR